MNEAEREAIEYGANALGVAAERMPSEFDRTMALEAEAVIRAFLERTQ